MIYSLRSLLWGMPLLLSTSVTALTLSEAFDRARRKSETLGQSRESVSQADSRHWQALGGLLPQVSLGGIFLRQQDPGGGLASSFSPADQTTLRLTASQPLFRGLKDWVGLRQKAEQREAQEEAYHRAEQQLFLDVAQTFYNSLALQRDVANLQIETDLNRKRLQDLLAFRNSGRLRESEILTVEANVANLEAQTENARAQLANAQEQLRFLLRTPEAELTAPEGELPIASTLESYIASLRRRPDILAAQREVGAAEAGVTIAWGNHLPSVDLQANYYFARPGFLSTVTWDVQAVATFPLFAGGVLTSQIYQAVSERKSKELALARTERQAEQEVRSLVRFYGQDRLQVDRLKKAKELTQNAYLAEKTNFQNGLSSNLEVLQASATAQATLRAYERAYLNAWLDWHRLQVAANLPIGK